MPNWKKEISTFEEPINLVRYNSEQWRSVSSCILVVRSPGSQLTDRIPLFIESPIKKPSWKKCTDSELVLFKKLWEGNACPETICVHRVLASVGTWSVSGRWCTFGKTVGRVTWSEWMYSQGLNFLPRAGGEVWISGFYNHKHTNKQKGRTGHVIRLV